MPYKYLVIGPVFGHRFLASVHLRCHSGKARWCFPRLQIIWTQNQTPIFGVQHVNFPGCIGRSVSKYLTIFHPETIFQMGGDYPPTRKVLRWLATHKGWHPWAPEGGEVLHFCRKESVNPTEGPYIKKGVKRTDVARLCVCVFFCSFQDCGC